VHVLICDDDKTTRFVINRLLVQRLNFRVTECRDGVEALERLAAGDIDLMILDISMPTLDGVDVLEAVRRSPQFGRLPVIVLSHERREEVVTKLIHLGIVGYVTKPPTAESLLAVVERARRVQIAESQRGDIRLDAETPALLVDGNPEYRRHFVAHAEAYGRITALESGLAVLAEFKRDPCRLVFVGSDLGVVGPELLMSKLREMRKQQPLRIVELRDADDQASSTAGADDVMPRTLQIAEHRQAVRRFVRVTGPLDDLSAVIGDVGEMLTVASTQVFGRMLDSAVHPSTAQLGVTDVCATFQMTVRHQHVVRVDFCLTKPDATRMAARARSQAVGAVTETDVTLALTKIVTLVRQQVQATIAARYVECECSSPRVRHQESMEIEVPLDGYGLQLPFASAAGESFVLLATVAKHGQRTAVA
jgi:CheY-like chemotaxis protein